MIPIRKIQLLADSVSRKYNTTDPFDICASMGYLVLIVPLTDIRGFFQRIMRNNIIYISDSLPEHIQRWVCAHELGHALLHKESNAIYLDSRTLQCMGKYENEANAFAARLLCPQKDYVIGWTAEQISNFSGVPVEWVEKNYK